ncbi:hypothetical protein M407DRAFT_30484, partial [Tulasnella calospora MUT 4182]
MTSTTAACLTGNVYHLHLLRLVTNARLEIDPASSPRSSTLRDVALGSAHAGCDSNETKDTWNIQYMQNFDIDKLLGLKSLPYADEHIRDPIGWFSLTFNPFSDLPDPLQWEITSPPSPSSANTDSPVIPPDLIISSLEAFAEMPPDPGLVPPITSSTVTTASSASPLLASSAFNLFSPTTVYAASSASPPALKRRFSLMDLPDQSPDPTPGPLDTRPTKRPCTTSFPGESAFQLDPTVTPVQPTESTGQQMGRPREPRPDYSLCKCEGGLTSKPARHWRVCPYNPERGAQPFGC